jgi:hypothetical protein
MAMRRSFLDEALKLPIDVFRIRADYFYQVLASLMTEIGVIEEPLSYYRIHGKNGYSGAFTREKFAQDVTLIESFSMWLSEHLSQSPDPRKNYPYVRASVYLARQQRQIWRALRVFRTYLASVGTGGFHVVDLWRVLSIILILIFPDFALRAINLAMIAAFRLRKYAYSGRQQQIGSTSLGAKR